MKNFPISEIRPSSTVTPSFVKGFGFHFFTLFLVCVFSTACERRREPGAHQNPETAIPTISPTKTESLLDSINTRLNSASDYVTSVSPHAKDLQNATVEEMDKLFQVEYKVLEIPRTESALNLEKALGEAGKEGWECFSIVPGTSELRVVCKRRPKSVLRYLKAVPMF